VKVRLRDNSIRLRLTRTEVSTLAAGEAIDNATPLGVGEDQTLTFRIRPQDTDTININHDGLCIDLCVPIRRISDWAETDRVGLEEDVPLTADRVLHVLIEKDFTCLAPRPGDEDVDTFANPAACAPSV
jgi:hypothetical protein